MIYTKNLLEWSHEFKQRLGRRWNSSMVNFSCVLSISNSFTMGMYMLISELIQCTCMCLLYNNNIYTPYCAWFSTQLQSVSVKHGCNTGYYWKQQRNALDIRCNKSNNRFYFKLCQQLNRYTVIRKYKIIIEILQSLWNEQGV